MLQSQYPGISFQQIQVFLAAAKYENFRMTAEEINMTQATISRNIKLLEEQTGIILFVRHQQRVRLTSAGKQLAKDLNRLQIDLSRAIDKALNLQKCEYNKLSIGDYDTTSMDDYLFPVITEFEKTAPDVEISVIRRHPMDIISGMNEKRFDLVFVLTVSKDMFTDPDLEIESICKVEPRIIISRKHSLFNKESLTYEDFLSCEAILLNAPFYRHYNSEVLSILRQYGFPESHVFYAEDAYDVALELQRGDRFAILDDYFAPVSKDNFRYIPLPDCKVKFEIQIAYSRQNDNPHLASFLKLVHEKFLK